MLEAKHTATNTKFRHKYCNITTWKNNTIKKIFNQIDYITVKNKLLDLFKLKKYTDVDADHRVVIASFSCQIKKTNSLKKYK